MPLKGLIEQGAMAVLRPPRRSGRVGHLMARLKDPFAQVAAFGADYILISQGSTYDAVVGAEWERLRRLLDNSPQYSVVCHGNDEAYIPNDEIRARASSLFRGACRVCFVSIRNRELAERQLAAMIPNACIVTNPVNLTDITSIPWPEQRPLAMAVVARLDAGKGLDLLIEALSRGSWPKRHWSVDVYGEGPYRGYYEDLTKHWKLELRVSFRGYCSDIRRIWRNHHLLVLPSRSEGVPLSMVEAMLCGRPVLVTDVGGIGEWVEEGREGFIAPAASTSSVALALDRMWQRQEDLAAMGITARSTALARFEPEAGKRLLDAIGFG